MTHPVFQAFLAQQPSQVGGPPAGMSAMTRRGVATYQGGGAQVIAGDPCISYPNGQKYNDYHGHNGYCCNGKTIPLGYVCPVLNPPFVPKVSPQQFVPNTGGPTVQFGNGPAGQSPLAHHPGRVGATAIEMGAHPTMRAIIGLNGLRRR